MLKNLKRLLTSYSSLFFFIVSIAFITDPARAQDKGDFCLTTFNLYDTVYSGDRSKRMKAVTDYVEENPCDIWTFQELWLEPDIAYFRKVLGSSSSGSHFVVGKSPERNGLAIFSNHLLTDTKLFIYDKNYAGFFDFFRKIFGVKKGFLVATRNMGAAGKFHIVTTHLHHLNKGIRQAQLAQLLEYLKSIPMQDSIILAGDFNSEPDSVIYKNIVAFGFKDSFIDRTNKDCTYCGINPYGWTNTDRTIDYIFYKPAVNLDISIKKVSVVGKNYGGQILSDHYAVRALLEWQIKKAPPGG